MKTTEYTANEIIVAIKSGATIKTSMASFDRLFAALAARGYSVDTTYGAEGHHTLRVEGKHGTIVGTHQDGCFCEVAYELDFTECDRLSPFPVQDLTDCHCD
jgi:hypothetical protein